MADVVAVSLTPGQQRELEALASELTTTDPQLARELTGSRPSGRGALRIQLLALCALLGCSAAGLTPLALGLVLGLPWLAGVGAVTTCVLPYAGVWATFALCPRWRDRLRALG